jgi:hypothetical protein
MKLYRLDMDNGYPYEDNYTFTMLIVAEDEIKAQERAKQELKNNDFNNPESGCSVEEIKQIDGYEIVLKRINPNEI